MLQQFLNHIQENSLVNPGEKILLAVSGGVDSMVMLDLFLKAEIPVGVAHCNFQLRPMEAKKEEALVMQTCSAKRINLHHTVFDTIAFSSSRGISIQEAARMLRYDFFFSLMDEHKYARLATAHHHNDNIETVLLNLVRGTGLEGLTGIPLVNGRIIRPILFATKDEIVAYAASEHVSWLEDSSNSDEKYSRNLIRRRIVPLLKEINPGLEETFIPTVARLTGAQRILEDVVSKFIERSCSSIGDRLLINRNHLAECASPLVVLWEVLKRKQFHFDQVNQILRASHTGKAVSSETHVVLVDRESLIVQPKHTIETVAHLIGPEATRVHTSAATLKLEYADPGSVESDPNVACLDADKIAFPLQWRKWKNGDSFYPLGMHQRKKISDFLIDLKIDRIQKENVTVIESNGEIIWVVGLRISDKVKLTAATKRVLRLTIE